MKKNDFIGCFTILGTLFLILLLYYLLAKSFGVPECIWARDPITCIQVVKLQEAE